MHQPAAVVALQEASDHVIHVYDRHGVHEVNRTQPKLVT